MSFLNDPIRHARRQLRNIRLIMAGGVGLCALMAIWIARDQAFVIDDRSPAIQHDPPQRLAAEIAAIDPAVFQVRLWNPAPDAAKSELADLERERPTPPALQLIAVIHDGDALKAALYDPAQDKLLILSHGERVGRYRLQDVTASGIVLAEGAWRHELRLKSPSSRGRS